MNDLKIAIVYQYVAHYREHIFERLLNNNFSKTNCSFTLFSDVKSNVPSIKTVDFNMKSQCWDWRVLRNHWILNKFLWQAGLLRDVAMNKEFDAVIFLGNVYYLSTWVGIVVSKLFGKRVILWTHGVRVKEHGLKSILRRFFYSLADGLLLYGERAKRILAQEGRDPDSMRVVFNSMDYGMALNLSEFRSLANCEVLEESDRLRIVFSGRLTYEKKVELLLEAVSHLKFPFSLTIIGGGPALDKLRKLAADLDIGRDVLFVGECYDQNVLAETFSSSHICVIPSAGGLSVLHALSFGVPVITDDDFSKHGPEVEAIKVNQTGGLYKRGDVRSLAEEIVRWRTRMCGSDIYSMRESCRGVVRDSYTADQQSKFIIDSVLHFVKKR